MINVITAVAYNDTVAMQKLLTQLRDPLDKRPINAVFSGICASAALRRAVSGAAGGGGRGQGRAAARDGAGGRG
jgi:hypothetical protein